MHIDSKNFCVALIFILQSLSCGKFLTSSENGNPSLTKSSAEIAIDISLNRISGWLVKSDEQFAYFKDYQLGIIKAAPVSLFETYVNGSQSTLVGKFREKDEQNSVIFDVERINPVSLIVSGNIIATENPRTPSIASVKSREYGIIDINVDQNSQELKPVILSALDTNKTLTVWGYWSNVLVNSYHWPIFHITDIKSESVAQANLDLNDLIGSWKFQVTGGGSDAVGVFTKNTTGKIICQYKWIWKGQLESGEIYNLKYEGSRLTGKWREGKNYGNFRARVFGSRSFYGSWSERGFTDMKYKWSGQKISETVLLPDLPVNPPTNPIIGL